MLGPDIIAGAFVKVEVVTQEKNTDIRLIVNPNVVWSSKPSTSPNITDANTTESATNANEHVHPLTTSYILTYIAVVWWLPGFSSTQSKNGADNLNVVTPNVLITNMNDKGAN